MTATATRGLLALLALAAAGRPELPRDEEREIRGERRERALREEREREHEKRPRAVRDDPALRARALLEKWGVETDASRGQKASIAAHESRRWAHLLPGAHLAAPLGAEAWVSLGPEDAEEEYNEGPYDAVDSGRPTAIAVDPRDPNVVYIALAGGGVWKTWNFISGAPNPTWVPIGEALGGLAVGALALDPSHPDTVYLALGDAFDQTGNGVYKSTNGGGTWTGVTLPGTPAPSSARDLKVDPTDPSRVWVLTDAGLFLSTDAGQSFAAVSLPGPNGGAGAGFWSLAWTGGSRWVLSGGKYDASYSFKGDLWLSDDGGRTWSSLGQSGALPATTAGRITLAAGNPARAGGAVVYAFAANGDGSAQLGFWRSLDGGRTWTNASGTLANPTFDSTCADQNVGQDQSWYNQAIAVDPGNDDHVIAGGSLCSVRTLNGTSASPTWELSSVWLNYGSDSTSGGDLPYVHADWHAALIFRAGGLICVIAGTDGGIYSSANLFAPGSTVGSHTTSPATWTGNNKGLVTHLLYSIGSGDPSRGNPNQVLMGLQDNGTRIRVPTRPTVFNQVIGGDGIGVAVGKGTSGEFLWGTVVTTYPGAYLVCRASVKDCTHGPGWENADPPVSGDQFAQFDTRFENLPTDATGAGFLTNTTSKIWRTDATLAWSAISPDFTPEVVRSLRASSTTANLFGAVLSGGKYAVTSDGVTWTTSQPLSAGGESLRYATTLDFPPSLPVGASAGDVFVVGTAAPTTESGNPVPDAVGHLFFTTDRGQTWTPIHGDGSGDDLPNVPVFAVRYDPTDASDQTLYVGTDLGVYRTTNGGRTWERFGAGLPLVRVTDLYLPPNASLLRIATYGRGAWEIYPSSGAWRGVSGDGDFDRNQAIDFRDLGALTTRMGTDPSTRGWPTYSWIVDLDPGAASPAVSGIDDGDLSALLGKFGGHP